MPYAIPETREIELHGVKIRQTKLQGKWYTTVDSRVKVAEQADPAAIRRAGASYNVTNVQIIPVADKWAYTCMVEYPAGSQVWKPGSDFIDTKDATGLAKAETSAIGRALGLHGIAIEESIASLDEMRRVAPQFAYELDEGERVVDAPVARNEPQTTPQTRPAAPTLIRQPNGGKPATEKQIAGIHSLSKSLKRPEPENLDALTFDEASKLMGDLSKAMEAKRNGIEAPAEEAQSEVPPSDIIFRLMQTEKLDSLVLDMYCARPVHQIKRNTDAGLMQLAAAMQSANGLAEMKILRWITNSKLPFTISHVDQLMHQEGIKDYEEFAQRLVINRDDMTQALKNLAS